MVCNKCGRPVSSRLSKPIPLCMRCRYMARRKAAPSIAAKIKPRKPDATKCAQCGNEIPAGSGSKYCKQCARHRKGYVIKICTKCGKEFETSRTNGVSRDLCFGCKPKGRWSLETKKAAHRKLSDKQKAEKMRAIEASGLTYGKYMQLVHAGLPIPEPETAPVPDHSWMPELGWIPIGEEPKGPASKATLKIRIK